jgi:hypothetical protein
MTELAEKPIFRHVSRKARFSSGETRISNASVFFDGRLVLFIDLVITQSRNVTQLSLTIKSVRGHRKIVSGHCLFNDFAGIRVAAPPCRSTPHFHFRQSLINIKLATGIALRSPGMKRRGVSRGRFWSDFRQKNT